MRHPLSVIAGLAGLEVSRRKRLESFIGRAVESVGAASWALGFFDQDGNLAAFDSSGLGLDHRTALTLLSIIPLPSCGPITLAAKPHAEKLPAAIGSAALTAAGDSVALVLVLSQRHREQASQAADVIQECIAQIAEEVGDIVPALGEVQKMPATEGPHAFFLLTPRLEVDFEWHAQDGESVALAQLIHPADRRLPLFFERTVRRLTFGWNLERIATCVPAMAYPIRGLRLRVMPMRGRETHIGVFLDRYADVHHVETAATQFRISAREQQVLHALFDGHSISDIAAQLNLAESTVNDHIARMIGKTNSRNRIEMAATLLGWPAMRKSQVQHDRAPRSNGRSHSNGTRLFSRDDDGLQGTRCAWRSNIATDVLVKDGSD